MKKCLILLFLLLALSVGGICAMTFDIDKDKDTFEIYETVLHGDSSAVNGIAVKTEVYNAHLNWKISYTAGENPETDVKFTFYQERQYYDDYERVPAMDIYPVDGFGISSTSAISEEDLMGHYGKMAAVIMDVAGRTEPGKSRTEEVKLIDYMEYYELRFSFNFFQIEDNEYVQETLNEYFKIPVSEDAVYEVNILKNNAGEIISADLWRTSGGDYWALESLVTDDSVYLLFFGTLGKDVKGTDIYGESGIFRLPLLEAGQDGRKIDFDNIEIIRSVKYDTQYFRMLHGAEKQILLLYIEDGKLVFDVFDTEKNETVQLIPLFDAYDDIYIQELIQEEDLMLVQIDNGDFVLLSAQNGEYRPELTNNMEAPYYWNIDIDYDGENLAVVTEYNLNFHMWVFDNSSLRFEGEYNTGGIGGGNMSTRFINVEWV